MGFITTMMVAELRADHARTGLRAAFDMACKDSRNDALAGSPAPSPAIGLTSDSDNGWTGPRRN
jgi:hypothetical protein